MITLTSPEAERSLLVREKKTKGKAVSYDMGQGIYIGVCHMVSCRVASSARRANTRPPPDEENPCWWVLSALESFEGKEARETYYY
jgi:hypothetical protein